MKTALEKLHQGIRQQQDDLEDFKGPKAIGQIFGISYVYSLFWKFGLIRVPAKVEEKLRAGEEKEGWQQLELEWGDD